MHTYESKEEKRKFLLRTFIISSALIINVTGIYIYYYVLIFNTIVPGKVYGESTFNGGRYEIYTLKYFYQHKGISYFDKIDYVMAQDLQLGDSIDLRVFNPYPGKHRVHKVFRDESKTYHYNCEDGFIIRYNEYIEALSDYIETETTSVNTQRGKRIVSSINTPHNITNSIAETIDNIRFNQGSLIDYYMLKVIDNSIYIYSVYHYMNDFSTDAMPAKVMYNELKKHFPEKTIRIAVLELDNPKKERILDTAW